MNEKAIEFIIEYLENKGQKTNIEDDIIKTWKDLNRKPFDYEKAKIESLKMMLNTQTSKRQLGLCRQQP